MRTQAIKPPRQREVRGFDLSCDVNSQNEDRRLLIIVLATAEQSSCVSRHSGSGTTCRFSRRRSETVEGRLYRSDRRGVIVWDLVGDLSLQSLSLILRFVFFYLQISKICASTLRRIAQAGSRPTANSNPLVLLVLMENRAG
jgi:hypothetical protein